MTLRELLEQAKRETWPKDTELVMPDGLPIVEASYDGEHITLTDGLGEDEPER